jgi:hypothetical protein
MKFINGFYKKKASSFMLSFEIRKYLLKLIFYNLTVTLDYSLYFKINTNLTIVCHQNFICSAQ